MDYDQLEMHRETIFKDAVLKGAEQKAQGIVQRAKRLAERALRDAQLACEEADYEVVSARYKADAQRQFGAMNHAARRELLALREELVEQVFAEVEQHLAAFAESEKYEAWLVVKLQQVLAQLPADTNAVVYLREQDMRHATALAKAAPGVSVQQDAGLPLGGLKVAANGRLYDMGMCAMLNAQRQGFYQKSGLQIE